MSVQLQKMKFAAIVAGLAIGATVALGPVAANKVHAAASSADCLKPLSIQEQMACNEKQQTAESGFSTAVAWLFPSAEDKITKTSERALSAQGEKKPGEGALSFDSLSTTGLMLFGAALVGIAYLGRRRRRSFSGLQASAQEKQPKK